MANKPVHAQICAAGNRRAARANLKEKATETRATDNGSEVAVLLTDHGDGPEMWKGADVQISWNSLVTW
jgi:hypothetical protein